MSLTVCLTNKLYQEYCLKILCHNTNKRSYNYINLKRQLTPITTRPRYDVQR